jgi:hypothetical protein
MSNKLETVRLTQAQDYRFDVQFGPDLPLLRADEPPPLGQGTGLRRCNCWRRPWATA